MLCYRFLEIAGIRARASGKESIDIYPGQARFRQKKQISLASCGIRTHDFLSHQYKDPPIEPSKAK